jgi:hypothetical protein
VDAEEHGERDASAELEDNGKQSPRLVPDAQF